MGDSLVATRLPPWAHRPAVARPQLVARLRAGLEGPLTLLCAPAGCGKTSLALQALDGYGAAVAWLSLELDDSEPTRFAHDLLATIARAAPALAPVLDPLLGSSPLDLRATRATLVNLLSGRAAPLVLVLEDYHTLDAPAVTCFNMDFPDYIRQAGRAGTDVMLVPANDWRGIAPFLTYMASYRGIENGFSIVRSAGHGLSAAFDYQGRMLATADYFTTEHAMVAHVPGHGVKTIYSVIGDLVAWLRIVGFVTLVGLALFRPRST